MAPMEGTSVVVTPWACAFASQSRALPPQVTLRLYAAHHVHCPNGKRSGKPPAGTQAKSGRGAAWGAAGKAAAALPTTAGVVKRNSTAAKATLMQQRSRGP